MTQTLGVINISLSYSKALPGVLCCPKESDGEVIGSRLVPTFSSTGSKSNVNLQSTTNFILFEHFFLDCRGFWEVK